MSAGISVYVILIVFGVVRAHILPIPGHQVAIVGGVEENCVTNLYEACLRAAIIAWSDGVFAG